MQSNLPPSAAKYCHQVQSYAAIQCSGVLPPSAITKGCAKSHPRRRRAVPRLRFDQDDVRFELRRVRCGLPTIRELTLGWFTQGRLRIPTDIVAFALQQLGLELVEGPLA